ncbi:hypothetical protein OHA10_13400 [Kribbella sp. NBC_00662]|uniref:hypothetical protein n=1 Tax=Kribbella sp. NBC_00662 TaxID=2975969 RepID=UPI0032561137
MEQLDLTGCFIGGLATRPDEAIDDGLVELVAAEGAERGTCSATSLVTVDLPAAGIPVTRKHGGLVISASG